MLPTDRVASSSDFRCQNGSSPFGGDVFLFHLSHLVSIKEWLQATLDVLDRSSLRWCQGHKPRPGNSFFKSQVTKTQICFYIQRSDLRAVGHQQRVSHVAKKNFQRWWRLMLLILFKVKRKGSLSESSQVYLSFCGKTWSNIMCAGSTWSTQQKGGL